MSFYTIRYYEELAYQNAGRNYWLTVEEATILAEKWAADCGYLTEIVDADGAVVWSSSEPDARWRKLRERVTAEMERDSQISNDYAGERCNTWGAVLDFMKELESEGGGEQ